MLSRNDIRGNSTTRLRAAFRLGSTAWVFSPKVGPSGGNSTPARGRPKGAIPRRARKEKVGVRTTEWSRVCIENGEIQVLLMLREELRPSTVRSRSRNCEQTTEAG